MQQRCWRNSTLDDQYVLIRGRKRPLARLLCVRRLEHCLHTLSARYGREKPAQGLAPSEERAPPSAKRRGSLLPQGERDPVKWLSLGVSQVYWTTTFDFVCTGVHGGAACGRGGLPERPLRWGGWRYRGACLSLEYRFQNGRCSRGVGGIRRSTISTSRITRTGRLRRKG